MKNQLETLNEVISKFTDEEKELMNKNRFPYIFSILQPKKQEYCSLPSNLC